VRYTELRQSHFVPQSIPETRRCRHRHQYKRAQKKRPIQTNNRVQTQDLDTIHAVQREESLRRENIMSKIRDRLVDILAETQKDEIDDIAFNIAMIQTCSAELGMKIDEASLDDLVKLSKRLVATNEIKRIIRRYEAIFTSVMANPGVYETYDPCQFQVTICCANNYKDININVSVIVTTRCKDIIGSFFDWINEMYNIHLVNEHGLYLGLDEDTPVPNNTRIVDIHFGKEKDNVLFLMYKTTMYNIPFHVMRTCYSDTLTQVQKDDHERYLEPYKSSDGKKYIIVTPKGDYMGSPMFVRNQVTKTVRVVSPEYDTPVSLKEHIRRMKVKDR